MTKLLIILFTLPIITQASTIVNLKMKLEKKIGCNLYVTSGDRTPEHNKKVGGAKGSYHLKKGKALDIRKNKSCKLSYKEIAVEAKEYFNGIIWYDHHLHLDLRTTKKVFYKGSY